MCIEHMHKFLLLLLQLINRPCQIILLLHLACLRFGIGLLQLQPLGLVLYVIFSLPAAVRGTGFNHRLGLPDKLFVAFDSVLLTGLGRVAMMPVLVLAARICPEVCPLLLMLRAPTPHPPRGEEKKYQKQRG